MRVLLINPGYEQNFWSFERTLRRLGKKVAEPPLGLITLAALLPSSWEFRLVEEFAGPVSEHDLAWAQVVMVTGISSQYQYMLANLRGAANAGKITVAGGPLAFHIPQEMLAAGAQVVVKGEAEPLAGELVEALRQRRQGLILETSQRPGLTTSPLPRYDLLDLSQYLEMAVQFSRGCPFNCDFCDITLRLGRRVRCKPPEQFIAELQALYDLGWRRSIFVVDDNFIGDRQQARGLLLALIPWMRQHGYPFDLITQTSLNLAQEPELMDLMAQAGFYRVFLGVETTDSSSLARAGKRQNLDLDLDQACQAITRAGFLIIAACVLGFDQEQPGAGQRFLDFIRRNHIPDVFASLLHALPGTALHQRLSSQDRLLSMGWEQNLSGQSGLCNFIPTRPQPELARELAHLFAAAYERREYIERLADSLATMPPWPAEQARQRPHLREVWAVLATVLQTDLFHPQRWRFWRQVGRGLFRFPSRMRLFWTGCLLVEHYREYAGKIGHELERRLAPGQGR